MANTLLLWKGAVQPASVAPSGNALKLWKGAVQPTKVGGGFGPISGSGLKTGPALTLGSMGRMGRA